jgi:hypothetical protein
MLLDCIAAFYIIVFCFIMPLVYLVINAEENKRRNSNELERAYMAEELYSAFGGPGKPGINYDDSNY